MPVDPTRWTTPPHPMTGTPPRPRQIGVEIEFAGLSVRSASEAVREAFGGSLTWSGSNRVFITDTALGDFRVEIDMHLAHRETESPTGAVLQEAAIKLASAVVPIEIVCPPIPLPEAHALDALCDRLKALGAAGTRDGALYAFGAQLNPELPDLTHGTILDTFRAFLLLRDWLRAEIDVDRLRRLWRFEQPFPDSYARLLLSPAYDPDMATLIDDYLRANPTRDRELDLLPLFCHLDEARVREALPGEKINPRPTWHYRLPNSEIGNEAWCVGLEWDRWVKVERLAENKTLLDDAARAWTDRANHLLPRSWTPESAALAAQL